MLTKGHRSMVDAKQFKTKEVKDSKRQIKYLLKRAFKAWIDVTWKQRFLYPTLLKAILDSPKKKRF